MGAAGSLGAHFSPRSPALRPAAPDRAPIPAPGFSHRGFRAYVRGFYLRFHMALILGGTGVAGVLVNRGLLATGVELPLARFPAGVALAYGVFFLLVRAWLEYVRSSAAQVVERAPTRTSTGDALDVAIEGAELTGEVAGEVADASALDADLEGLAVAVVAAVALAAVGVLGYVVWQGPVILVEAAFEMGLASGLVRATRRLDRARWAGSVLNATLLPFLVLLVLAVVAGAALDVACPGAPTFAAAVRQCLD